MPEIIERDDTGHESSPDERAGDILRKERITKRIAIETIARDLKLNVKYIKALEASDYAMLPADPYVRVYIRSIAKYLLLDPEEILKRFYQERGIPHESEAQERSTKINITVSGNDKPRMPWVAVIVLVVILATGVYVAKRMGLISVVPEQEEPVSDTTGTIENDELPEAVPYDSLGQDPSETHENAGETDKGSEPETSQEALQSNKMKLVLRAIADSVWVQLFADGKSRRNFIRPNRDRVFTARDSFNLHVGNNINLRYTLDGRPLKNIRGSGVVAFRLDRSGVEMWSLQKWASVFEDRI